ncbi:MAG: CoA transferase [Deltaproteobacteria bacterium]|nr:CoA transferase [Deltaproteobacteria bacterium]
MGANRPKWAEWADWVREKDDPKVVGSRPEALDDLVVLDLSSQSYAGAYCSSMLSEFGAEVIRVEPPEGDFLRTCTPYGLTHQGEGLNYLTEGRNKYHVTLDLHKEEGREVLRGLAAQADVLLETFPVGAMDAWGLGYEQLKELNPGLIFASITANGQFGPQAQEAMPDYDNVAQAKSGIQYATGAMLPPGEDAATCPWAVSTKASPWIAWCSAGTFMATGILAALHWRHRTGLGQALDVATTEAYMRLDNYTHIWFQGGGHVTERVGGLDNALWLYCFAPTSDGGVFLGGLRLEMWQAFCDMMGKWDEWGVGEWDSLSPFLNQEAQLKYFPEVAKFTKGHTSDELVRMAVNYSQNGRLAPITTVIAPILSPQEALQDPNWNQRGVFTPTQDPVYGRVMAVQAQHKMTETPIRTKWVCRPVGYDNDFIYRKYMGFGPARLGRLREQGVL